VQAEGEREEDFDLEGVPVQHTLAEDTPEAGAVLAEIAVEVDIGLRGYVNTLLQFALMWKWLLFRHAQ
jgi:hypothetical protein